MPFEHVSPGRPIRISARDWNGAMDAARAAAGGGALPPPSPARPTGRERTLVKNNTGTDLPRFSILGISGVLFLPSDNLNEFKNRILFTGVTPTESHDGKFVVCTEPLADGKIGECVALGVVQVLVDDNEGDLAAIDSGETHFLTRGDSGAQILWVDTEEAETGLHWAVIAIGGGGGGECDPCPNVMEISTAGTVTGGSVSLTFTVDGTTGSAAVINHNDTAATVRSTIISANSVKLNTTNFLAYDGPWPMGAIYLRFLDNLAEMMVPLPAYSNSLTGTNASFRIRRFSTPGWE